MHKVMFQSTHLTVQKAQFIYFSCDELITINNHNVGFSSHLCYGRVEMLFDSFDIATVVEGSHANNLTKQIVKFLVLYSYFSNFDMSLKLVCFGANDVINILGFENWCYNVVKGKRIDLCIMLHIKPTWLRRCCFN